MFTLRFDMRAPDGATPAADLYAAAIEMCGWAEARGAIVAVLSEHHGTDDGHLPSPLILASAIAARTKQLAIMLAAVPIPLWDPVRLAEEMAVLDLVSGGRVMYAFGIGHRDEEYEHFAASMATRGRVADEMVAVIGDLVRGESVEYRGRKVRITPRCGSPNEPPMMIAGGSRAAARRAATHGLGFISQTDSPALREYYESQCQVAGHEPGLVRFPVPGTPTTAFVAEDVDEAWQVLGPHLVHDAVTAASYRPHDDSVASITRADTAAVLRETDARTGYSRPPRRPTTSAVDGRCRCTRCAAASRQTWRGHTSSLPRPPTRGRRPTEGEAICPRRPAPPASSLGPPEGSARRLSTRSGNAQT